MAAPKPGDLTSRFLQKGLRRSFTPAGVASKLAMVAVVAASFAAAAQARPVGDGNMPPYFDRPPMAAPAPAMLSTYEATAVGMSGAETDDSRNLTVNMTLEDGSAMYRVVQREAAKYEDKIPHFTQVMLAYAKLVNDTRAAHPEFNVRGLYGTDDGMTAWMMRNHAREAGLGQYMEGVTVNQDGSVDAKSPAKLAAMLEVQDDPVLSTKIFAAWYASEIQQFDGFSGHAPTLGEMAMIGLSDNENARFAADDAKQGSTAPLGDELQIDRTGWKRTLLDSRLGARDGAEKLEKLMQDNYAAAFPVLPVEAVPDAGTKYLDDMTTADIHKDHERYFPLVLRTADELGAKGHIDGAPDGTLGQAMLSLYGTILDLRGPDNLTGGPFAVGADEWFSDVVKYGHPAFVTSFTGGMKLRSDGTLHVDSAAAFGNLMALREHPVISAQIVGARLADQINHLQKATGHLPSGGELVVTHLFGLEKGIAFSKEAAEGRDWRTSKLHLGDADPSPDTAWLDYFRIGHAEGEIPSVGAIKGLLDDHVSENARNISNALEQMEHEQHAEAAPRL